MRRRTGGPQPNVLRVVGEATFEAALLRPRLLARIAGKYYLRPASLRLELAHASRWALRSRDYAQQPYPGFVRVRPREWEVVAA